MTADRVLDATEPLRDGDVVTLTLIVSKGYARDNVGSGVLRMNGSYGLDTYRTDGTATVTRPAPPEIAFQPGDVVLAYGRAFLRGLTAFTGVNGGTDTDAFFVGKFKDGHASLIVRDGVVLTPPIDRDNLHLLPVSK